MGRPLVLAGSAAGILAIILSLAIAVIAAQSASAGQRGNNAAPPATPPCGPNLPVDIKNVAKDSRCFELRIYTVREGSSADLLHSRFRDHTTALHAIEKITELVREDSRLQSDMRQIREQLHAR